MNNDTRFANQYNIQWFPGHMTKTLRMMETEIQHVDASLVLLDARIPLSSLNPEVERITARKPKLYVLNKADLADPAVTEEWIRYFRAADAGCVAISAKQKGGAKAVQTAIEKELASLLERRQNRGMGGAKTQVMLCGIPNVGKSTFINTFAGSARAKAADRPGVTKGQHWHNTKWEFFIVVSGHGLIQQRKVGTGEVLNFEVSGEKIEAVHMLPGYTHNIINLSETEDLVTLMWANECFDPKKPDTFFEVV